MLSSFDRGHQFCCDLLNTMAKTIKIPVQVLNDDYSKHHADITGLLSLYLLVYYVVYRPWGIIYSFLCSDKISLLVTSRSSIALSVGILCGI